MHRKSRGFLSRAPAMRAGETFDLLFTQDRVDIMGGGKTIGEVTDTGFAGCCKVLRLSRVR
jgi:hypothetical protein